MVLLSAAATRAEESAVSALAADANAAPAAPATTASTAPVAAGRGRHRHLLPGLRSGGGFHRPRRGLGSASSGSPTKVGEYQDLESSPFWNADGIWSNGDRTVDFSATGSDNETSDGRLHYFGPHVEADLDYERFPHQLDAHDYRRLELSRPEQHGRDVKGPDQTGTNPQTDNIVLFTDNNLSPGQDYAIRVQECKANFKGNITENLKWRVNVFGIDKEGMRQVNELPALLRRRRQRIGAGPATAALPIVGTASSTRTHNRRRTRADGNLTSQCHVTSQSPAHRLADDRSHAVAGTPPGLRYDRWSTRT